MTCKFSSVPPSSEKQRGEAQTQEVQLLAWEIIFWFLCLKGERSIQ